MQSNMPSNSIATHFQALISSAQAEISLIPENILVEEECERIDRASVGANSFAEGIMLSETDPDAFEALKGMASSWLRGTYSAEYGKD